MISFFTDDVPDSIESRWDQLISKITPDMERGLKREAYMCLGNLSDVQDVMQEVLIKAAMNYDKLKDDHKLYAWLMTITKRECIAHVSRFSIKSFISRARMLTGFISHTVDIWEHLITDEEKQNLLSALESLDDESRKIVVLKSTTDLSLKEIAEKLHMNYHTTRSKYHRALSLLRDIIQEDEPNERHK